MERPNSSSRPAYTMLELIAVMVLLGLVSTIAMLSVIGHLEQSELVRATHQIANADRKEREATRLSPFPGGLIFERSKQRLQFISSGRKVELGNRIKIAEVVVNQLGSGSSQILFTQAGQSQTYAVRLESKRGASNWVMVVGMTGQVIVSDSTEEMRKLLALGS